MRGNSFGKLLSMVSFGESHGPALGVVVDGVPGGLSFCLEDLKSELERRAPGKIQGTTARVEDDDPEILSGILEGKTLGTPIAIIVRSKGQRSSDYDSLKNEYRPGHADRTTVLKYGIRDHRGGGRSSGRETLSRVIGGYCASLIVPHVKVKAFASRIGPFHLEEKTLENLDINQDFGPYGFPSVEKWGEIENFLLKCKNEGDSVGGRVQIIVEGVPGGLGEPVFDKLKADFAKALLSIGACTSFSYGAGEDFEKYYGQEVSQKASFFGGMEGGISNGERMEMRVTFKPPSTVGEKAKKGRHDPCVIPRALPVIESMVKFVLADHYLRQQAYQDYDNSQ